MSGPLLITRRGLIVAMNKQHRRETAKDFKMRKTTRNTEAPEHKLQSQADADAVAAGEADHKWDLFCERVEKQTTNRALRTLSFVAAHGLLHKAWADGGDMYFNFDDDVELLDLVKLLGEEKVQVCFHEDNGGAIVWHHDIKNDDADTWYLVHVMLGLFVRLKPEEDTPAA